jgi:dGTPase
MNSESVRNKRRHPKATRSSSSQKEDFRTPSQKDRDRILYSSSFRRLAQVTQVISADVGHVFHNRLTHSLQVAQVGRRLAERLGKQFERLAERAGGVDPDVVEAACCAHDLGHPPFGHVVEKELNQLAGDDIDGFEGNAQSFRIVTKLSQNSRDHRGLDLTRATLAAILKYPWFRGDNALYPHKWGAYRSEKKDFDFARETAWLEPNRASLEAKLMDWSDDITYSVHDLDDFFRAHKIPLHLFCDAQNELEPRRFIEAAKLRHPGDTFWSDAAGAAKYVREFLGGLFPLTSPYTGRWEERAALRNFTSTLIGQFINGTSLIEKNGSVVLERKPDTERAVEVLQELTWVYVIEAPSLASQQRGQRLAIQKLYEIYMSAAQNRKEWNLFPAYYRDMIEEAAGDGKLNKRAVIDLLAGMTEEQALTMYRRLIGISVGSGLDDIV